MLDRAQDLIKQLQERVRTTMQVVADLAESVGVPPAVTSLLHRNDADPWTAPEYQPPTPTPAPEPKAAPAPVKAAPAPAPAPAAKAAPPAPKAAAAPAPKAKAEPAKPALPAKPAATKKAATKKAATKRAAKKRVVEGNKAKSAKIRPLQVDDAINGSTYLARIIWSLGVAQLEGLGPLRPADIARMVMSRSAVSLEPPNVARYIRRSKPNCITVSQAEGSSSYYKLNTVGKKLFDETFGPA